MSKQEKIVCPASRYYAGNKEKVTLYVRYPENINEFDIRGVGRELGFITSMERFVDPKEAMSLAINNNQIRELSNLYTKWIEWQLVGDERWKDVHECWREMKDELENRELKPEDLY